MSDVLPPLILELRARAGQVYSELGKVGSSVKKLDKETEGGLSGSKKAFNTLAGVGKAALFGIGGAALAVGGMSLKLGADFQEATTQLVTGAGESEDNLKMVRSGLIAMAPAVGMGPEALAKAMFLVESAGYHGADGLKVMKAAAEGAKIGGADATTVANGLTTALTDYHLSAGQAATVTSQLIATVAAGKTNMQDLSGSLSAVLPAAASAHVGLQQVLGAMGTMTGEGISAQQSSQDLANTIRSLGNPTAVATKAMAQMGINSTTVAQQLGSAGLTGTLGYLTHAILTHMGPAGLVLQSSFNQSQLAAQSANEMLKQLPKSLQNLARGYLNGTVTQKEWTAALKTQPALTANLGKQFATTAKEAHGFADNLKSGGGAAKTYNAILSEMTGGATGLSTALALTGPNMGTFTQNVRTIGSAATEAGGHVKGWSETQKDFKTQMAQAKAGVEAMGVKIGTALIPVVQKVIQIGTQWTDWLMKHKPVLIAIASVVGGALVLAIGAYVVSMASAAVATIAATWPILAIIAAAAAVVVGILYLSKHWQQVWGDIKKWASDGAQWIKRIFGEVINVAFAPFRLYFRLLAWEWRTAWNLITSAASWAWNSFLLPIFRFIMTYGINPIRDGISAFAGFWSNVWNGIANTLTGIWNNYIQPVVGFIQDAINNVMGAISSVSGAVSKVGGFMGKVGGFLGFDEGGFVPGALGAPMLAVVHGGEYVVSNDMQSGRKPIDNRALSGVAGKPFGSSNVGSGASIAGGMWGGGGVIENHTVVVLDGRVVQSSVERRFLQKAGRRSTTYQGFHR